MEPAIGRFTTMDPHAENYYCWSPYHYAGNNPLRITDPTGMDWYQDETGNYHWKEGSDEDIEGFVNIGSSVSLQTGKNSCLNFYQQAGIATNKAVNAFDLISSSTGLQSKLLGNGSPLSEQSKSQLFNALVGKDVDAFARSIGGAVTEFGAGMLIGAAVAKALSCG